VFLHHLRRQPKNHRLEAGDRLFEAWELGEGGEG
jgi:hypothetical protein